MSDVQIQQVLSQMRALTARSGTLPAAEPAPDRVQFSTLLQSSLQQVNASQHEASTLATRFEHGDPGVSLAQVMVAGQKASLQFEAATQVRNRLIAAYQEIMNMQV
jgi:flagellar hook-basal body complex protein FliE